MCGGVGRLCFPSFTFDSFAIEVSYNVTDRLCIARHAHRLPRFSGYEFGFVLMPRHCGAMVSKVDMSYASHCLLGRA